jgi:hypothetical protein
MFVCLDRRSRLLWSAYMPAYNINIRTASHIADTLTVEKDDLTALRLERLGDRATTAIAHKRTPTLALSRDNA